MKTTRFVASLIVLVLAGGNLSAQYLSGGVLANPSAVGTPVVLRIYASQQLDLLSGCGLVSVHQGSPSGPAVYSSFICPLILISVSPGVPTDIAWNARNNANVPVPPDTYYIQVLASDPITSAVLPPFYFPVRIDDPAAPAPPFLIASGTPAIGSTINLNVFAPAYAGGGYIVAASLTTRVGWAAPGGGHIALDQDDLYASSFPVPNPAIFGAFQGLLDIAGQSMAPTVTIPALPALANIPLSLQAVVYDGAGYGITNPLTFSIQ